MASVLDGSAATLSLCKSALTEFYEQLTILQSLKHQFEMLNMFFQTFAEKSISSMNTKINFLMYFPKMAFIKHWNVARVLVSPKGMTLN
jgi:hypothetical protein